MLSDITVVHYLQRCVVEHLHVMLDVGECMPGESGADEVIEWLRATFVQTNLTVEVIDITPVTTRAEVSRILIQKPSHKAGKKQLNQVVRNKLITAVTLTKGRERGHQRNFSTESGGSGSDRERPRASGGDVPGSDDEGLGAKQKSEVDVGARQDSSAGSFLFHSGSAPKKPTFLFLIWGLELAREEVWGCVREFIDHSQVDYMGSSLTLREPFSLILLVKDKTFHQIPHDIRERLMFSFRWQKSLKEVLSDTPETIVLPKDVRLQSSVERFISEFLVHIRLVIQPIACGTTPLHTTRQDLGFAVRMLAGVQGRSFVTPDDVKILAQHVLGHRLTILMGDQMFHNDEFLSDLCNVDCLYCLLASHATVLPRASLEECYSVINSNMKRIKPPM